MGLGRDSGIALGDGGGGHGCRGRAERWKGEAGGRGSRVGGVVVGVDVGHDSGIERKSEVGVRMMCFA